MLKNLLVINIPPGIEAINTALKLVREDRWHEHSPKAFADSQCTYILYDTEDSKYYYNTSPLRVKSYEELTPIDYLDLVYKYINNTS